ncbi:MAG: (2Fe-2S)-binding protein [Syntrophaceticus sp.]
MAVYSFTLNGKLVQCDCRPDQTLLEVLREKFKLTGTKEGCGKGECGACTVIMNGQAVNSCLILIPQAQDKEIITIEGLCKDNELDVLQQSFIEEGAVQCGFCTPGMLMSSKALLMKNPKPSDKEIRTAISGNLCRCTGYTKIVKAVHKAADRLERGGVS